MKKFLLVLALVGLISAPVEARPLHRPSGHHRSEPTVVHKVHHKHHDSSIAAIVGGLAGFVIGSAVAAPVTTAPVLYTTTVQPEQCFAVVSRSTGKVTQRCLSSTNGANEILYVD